MNINKRVLTIALSAVMAAASLSGCGEETVSLTQEEAREAASKWYDVDSEYHSGTDYSQMELKDIDEQAISDAIEKLKEDGAAQTDESTITEDLDSVVDVIDDLSTQYVLTMIKHYADFTDEDLASRESDLDEMLTDYADQAYSAMRDALSGPEGDVLKSYLNDPDLVDDLLDYEDMTDREKELQKELTDLQLKYDSVSIENVTIDGREWNTDSLEQAYYDDEIDYDEYQRLYEEYYRQYNSDICDIYLQMIPVLNEMATINGYDNYAEEAYDDYNRDYTTEEIKSVYDGVKKYIVPLEQELEDNAVVNYDLYYMNLDEEEKIDRVSQIVGKVDPGLLDAWDYFTEHGLYDLEASDTKGDSGFTVTLYSYGSPFIFDSPYEMYEDVYTVVHEFGHYNNAYHEDRHALFSGSNLDVAEIHSQGLEVLSFKYADDLFGKNNAVDARYYKLESLLQAVISGCMYDEFQQEVYSYEGELDTKTLNDMYMKISAEYGQEYDEDTTDYYYWVVVPHTFSSPMYYISYATSALAALDILAMSTEDYQSAVDCYMDLTSYELTTGYRELLEDTGLPDVFEEENMEDISIALQNYVDTELNSSARYAYLVPYACAWAAVVIFGIVLLIMGLKKAAARRRDGLSRTGQYVRVDDPFDDSDQW